MLVNRPPSLSREEEEGLDEIFAGGQSPAETNSTLVPLRVMHSLKRKAVIDYDDIQGFRERFGCRGWNVSLTATGRRVYPRRESGFLQLTPQKS